MGELAIALGILFLIIIAGPVIAAAIKDAPVVMMILLIMVLVALAGCSAAPIPHNDPSNIMLWIFFSVMAIIMIFRWALTCRK